MVDLCAGAGGLSLGFENAGCDLIGAVEEDPLQALTYRFNFPECPVVCEDIRRVDTDKFSEVDVVIGGPPCSWFLPASKKDKPFSKLVLLEEFLRVAVAMKPQFIVMESAPHGFFHPRGHVALQQANRFLKEQGMDTRLEVLDASQYGLPQKIRRAFLVAAKPDDLHLFRFPPEKEHKFWNCQDALEDLPDIEDIYPLLKSDFVRLSDLYPPGPYAKGLMEPHLGYRRNWDHWVLTSSRRTFHSRQVRARFDSTMVGTKDPVSRSYRLHPSTQAPNLYSCSDEQRSVRTTPRPIHYRYPRVLTVREMARMSGFPDWFRFHAAPSQGFQQVGDAVPPPLAFSVACQIIRAMGVFPSSPKAARFSWRYEDLQVSREQAAEILGVAFSPARRISASR